MFFVGIGLITFLSAVLLVVAAVMFLFRGMRHKRTLKKMMAQNGWTLSRERVPELPPDLANETIHGMGNAEEYYWFEVNQQMRGQHRGREFIMITYGQRMYRKQEGFNATLLFTPISSDTALPPFFIFPSSAMMDWMMSADAAVKSMDKKRRESRVVSLPRLGISGPLASKYTVHGKSEARGFLSESVQEELLSRPELFRRNEEPWYNRHGTMPGTTERYAYLNIQDLHPGTFVNRLNSLMDWAEIVDGRLRENA